MKKRLGFILLCSAFHSFAYQLHERDESYVLIGHELSAGYVVYVPGSMEAEITNVFKFDCEGSRVEAVKIGSEINNAATYGEHLQYYFFLVRDHQFHVPLRIIESFKTVDKKSKEVLSEHLPFTKHDDLGLACDLIRPQVKSYYFSQAFEAIPKHTHSKGD
ncbi:hypothetical protein [Vibrio diabolicus]|uniref:DUF2057 domain-containing protein n=1 Tax=Vibrio diabolicus TaxID=50719 RepID=A0AAX1XSH5_9VIBR|nr:hypothetical protein [Vibrio diabolicus]MCQ9062669.1 hypothetical protein [Vibrio diabolicus]MCS0308223.1 hypothetical protein [Vibrio diabolicus]MCS0346816.1 hypothetical protein [Vibrio diabolicus]MCS0358920.1 hypothetical protein [Vibrio diabolicus]MCS0373471.1 hypothetical protein [Vibrio diabolicus]